MARWTASRSRRRTGTAVLLASLIALLLLQSFATHVAGVEIDIPARLRVASNCAFTASHVSSLLAQAASPAAGPAWLAFDCACCTKFCGSAFDACGQCSLSQSACRVRNKTPSPTLKAGDSNSDSNPRNETQSHLTPLQSSGEEGGRGGRVAAALVLLLLLFGGACVGLLRAAERDERHVLERELHLGRKLVRPEEASETLERLAVALGLLYFGVAAVPFLKCVTLGRRRAREALRLAREQEVRVGAHLALDMFAEPNSGFGPAEVDAKPLSRPTMYSNTAFAEGNHFSPNHATGKVADDAGAATAMEEYWTVEDDGVRAVASRLWAAATSTSRLHLESFSSSSSSFLSKAWGQASTASPLARRRRTSHILSQGETMVASPPVELFNARDPVAQNSFDVEDERPEPKTLPSPPSRAPLGHRLPGMDASLRGAGNNTPHWAFAADS